MWRCVLLRRRARDGRLQTLQDVIIVAEPGPNPAPLSELIWALFRERDCCV